ncbi:hypothetical protein GE061_001772 [Apolygus lucorum]|uniref:DEP domain-containing protein n=1 Tax=Apolygus lucorum TaxID=248454 RepID=A0A8S9X538_APOLU|nr:hypothetical protein GE061_001772 [Apolygus lucorum]
MNQRRYSTGIIFLKSNISSNSPFRERLGSNRLPEKPRPRSGSKVMERMKASQSIDTPVPTSVDANHAENEHDESHNLILKAGSDYHEIIEHMKNPSSGVGFLSQLPSLPKYTFVSADAVQWLMSHVEGVKEEEQAIAILEGMMKDKYICHASGDSSRRFIHGFYLYHIKYGKEELKDGETLPVGDLTGFENEWMEVEIKKDPAPMEKPKFLCSDLPACTTLPKTGESFILETIGSTFHP